MTIYINGSKPRVELERLCRLFFPYEDIRFTKDAEKRDSLHASINCEELNNKITISGKLYSNGKLYEGKSTFSRDSAEKETPDFAIADSIYKPLCEMTGYTPPWGMLTGVRPAKLMRMLTESAGEEAAKERFTKLYRCSEEKYNLCRETIRYEQPILSLSEKNSFSLYIGIPFCPTRCSYCSFVSQSIEMAAKLVPEYCELLVKELEATAQTAKKLGLKLETVYMGGGTPTTLSASQLDVILSAVNRYFDCSALREFTVEAGRPDTITKDKLETIKAHGVGRISINPQTLSDYVLEQIGRRHSVAQVYEAMELASPMGFDSINMDLIAGLKGDTPESFSKTLDGVFSLKPENITVHTLSMKRASDMVVQEDFRPDSFSRMPSLMLKECAQRLPVNGYHPYYLYRQTRMLGNLENVGWSKHGCDGLYNVYIMDETHTILACGAGGVTKLRQYGVNNIERIYNFKFPYEYISRFDSILVRKKAVEAFYDKFG